MIKKYFFLAGIPRSGNTLISSILNQNPDIMVSANSFLCDQMCATARIKFSDVYKNFPDEKSLDNLIGSTFDSYYKDWNAKYIIDRGPWGTPPNLYLLETYLSNEIKIICTVRDIVEIVASFIKLNPHTLYQFLQNQRERQLRFLDSYKEDVELLCEAVMDPSGQVEKNLFSLFNLLKEENRKYLHIVEYNDLVGDTDNTIKKIYDFLDIEYYPHKYNYINAFSANGIEYNDSVYGANLHKLKKEIKPKNYKVEDILPTYLIERYSNLEFWR